MPCSVARPRPLVQPAPLHNLGLENALRICHGLLRPGGYLAFTDAVWRKVGVLPVLQHLDAHRVAGGLGDDDGDIGAADGADLGA